MKYSLMVRASVVALLITTLTSCMMEAEDIDYDDVEQEILDDWMVENIAGYERWDYYDDDDDEDYVYYTIKTEDGDTSNPISAYSDCWIKYNLTGYDLEGNVYVTRDELIAYQLGSFDYGVRYIPIYQDLYFDSDFYSGDDTYDYLPKCLNLAFKNEDLNLCKGSKLIMYIPSEIVDGAATGSTGFAGQYAIGEYKPLKAVVEIVDIIADPTADETNLITAFAQNPTNGGLLINYRETNEDNDEDLDDEYYAAYNEMQELISQSWSNAMDTVPNLYIDRRYTPDTIYEFPSEYTSQIEESIYYKYTMTEIDEMIRDIVNDDDDDIFYENKLTGDFVEFSGNANVWYIGRFLDGFIFDTNIGGVLDLINNESDNTSSAEEYTSVSSWENSRYILAWYYAIPQLRYGQWATIITTSRNAYGEATGSSSIPANTPLMFHIYIEPVTIYD